MRYVSIITSLKRDKHDTFRTIEKGREYLYVKEKRTGKLLLRLRYEDGMYRRMDYHNLERNMITSFIKALGGDSSDARFKIVQNICRDLPLDMKCIVFCRYHHIGCDAGALLCSMSPPTFRKKLKQFDKYVSYMQFYYENKDIVDIVLGHLIKVRDTIKQKKYNIFTELFYNPFMKPSDLAMKYQVKASTIRSHVRDCCKTIREVVTIDEDFNEWADIITDNILDPFKDIVFDRLRTKKKVERKPRVKRCPGKGSP